MVHLNPRRLGWIGGILLAGWGAALWLLQPGLASIAGVLAGVILLVACRERGALPGTRAALAFGIALLAVMTIVELRRRGLESSTVQDPRRGERWEQAVHQELESLALRLRAAAGAAAGADVSGSERSFDLLGRIRTTAGPSAAIAILDREGLPLVWSGRFLAAPSLRADTLNLVRSPFYAVLEARRQREDGGMAVAAATLWRDDAVPANGRETSGTLRLPPGVTVRFEAPSGADSGAAQWPVDRPVLAFHMTATQPQDAVASLVSRARALVAWLLLLFLVMSSAAGASTVLRVAPVVIGLPLALVYPVGEALGASSIFSPAWFFSPVAGRLSSSAGALTVSAATLLLLGVALWGRVRLPRPLGGITGALVALAVPLVLRELARGITPPAVGVPITLWWGWHAALFLTGFATLLIAAALARGQGAPGPSRWPLIGSALSLIAAAIGIFAFTGRPGWPAWYSLLWIPGALLVVRPAATWASLTAIAISAGAGAALMTWGNALAARTVVALADVSNLGTVPDPLTEPALTELAASITAASRPPDASDLYRAWRRSGLRREGYPVRLMLWDGDQLAADVALDVLSLPDSVLGGLVRAAPPGQSIVRIAAGPGVHQVLMRRLDSTRVLSLAAGPRTQLIAPAVLGRLLETGAERSHLYRLTVTPLPGLDAEGGPGRWRREGWAIRAARKVTLPSGLHEAHLVIPLGRPVAILVRGGLLLLADVGLAFALWGAVLWLLHGRVLIRPPWTTRSFETRLVLTLAGFFVVPAALVSAVSIRQLAVEAERSRDLVLQRILRDATAAETGPIGDVARRLDAGLGRYRGGALVAASEPVLAGLGLIPPLVDDAAWHALVLDGEPFASSRESRFTRRGFAMMTPGRGGEPTILATVHEERDRELRDRQLDVALAFGLATLLGLVAAGGAARLAARTLSRPVADLRDAALAFGRGTAAPPFPLQPPREFEPVFTAFARMAADVRAGQDALEDARRRTEAVLATVPTGVLALDGAGQVILANPSARDMMSDALPMGRTLNDIARGEWEPLGRLAAQAAGAGEVEFEAGGRRYAAQVTPLDSGHGAVIAVNDVTVATRAARVLAWADVANQVAHAIKNPLTPLRLGIQHLRRVREQRPDQFDTALTETTERLLVEISRLDSIARAFARFAAPSEIRLPLAAVPLREVCEEVAALYRMAPGFDLQTDAADGTTVIARRDELKEVLLNLCDNARNAGASRVELIWEAPRLLLRDNGQGMTEEVLGHAFEPRFSTTSSGSGLGLAITRRLVESWGASISVESPPGRGATFAISFT
jgi:signal transduction histidine kinase